MNTTATAKLNGLGSKYDNVIAALAPTSVTGRFCARLDAIVRARKDGLSEDRFKSALNTLTSSAVDFAAEIIAEQGQNVTLQSFGDIFDSTYDAKHLKGLLHAGKDTSAYSDLIGAFGEETPAVSKRTLDVLTAATAFDSEHGIIATTAMRRTTGGRAAR